MPEQVTAPTTTQNALGFLGRLYQFGRRPNTLLRLIGGIGTNEMGEEVQVGAGWRRVNNYEYATNVDWELPAPSQPDRLEGADAPDAITYQPAQTRNVVQLFHEQVDVSYLAASTIGRMTSSGVLTAGTDPFQYFGRISTQINAQLGKIAQDANYSFLRGVFNNPANPTSEALRTRGILNAIETNVVSANGEALTDKLLNRLYREMIDASGVQPTQGLLVICNTAQLSRISEIYKGEIQSDQRTIGGNQVRQIFTAFGVLNIPGDGFEMDMPQDELVFVNPDVVSGVYLPVLDENDSERPALFFEELSRDGSKVRGQLYGQFGIDHGPEFAHAKLTDLEVESEES